MIIGALEVRLFIGGAQSLKEKRMVVRSLKDRIRQQFNVSVAEVDDHDRWQIATLAIVTVSNEKEHANAMLSKVVNLVESDGEARLEKYHITYF